HGEAGIDVSAAEVNAGARGGSDADHEVAGGRRNFEGDPHGLIHSKYLDGSGADAEQSGKRARAEHKAEAGGNMLDVVTALACEIGETAVHPQTGGERIWGQIALVQRARLAGKICRVEQDGAEDDRQGAGRNAGGQEGSEQRAEGG